MEPRPSPTVAGLLRAPRTDDATTRARSCGPHVHGRGSDICEVGPRNAFQEKKV